MIDATLKNANILIVDDQQANIDVLTSLLEFKEYTNLIQTTDSRLAVSLFKEREPDLIILDLMMPHIDGFQILEELKELIPAEAYLPILVLTADVTPDAKQIALAGGASDFLTKPFDLIEVDLRIKNLLTTRYLRQQLENQNQILEKKVKDRTKGLETANKELIVAKAKAEESDKLKSEFLAQMSHEIRTPLNAIVGNADYLKNTFGEKMGIETHDCFEGIDLASKRIIRTIDLILNTAELYTGVYKPHFMEIDLNTEILYKLFLEHQLLAKQKGLKFSYTCKEKETKVIVDEYGVTQVFANLIDNAVKYTKNGKVEMLLKKNNTGNITVEVKDTGIGIRKAFLPKIFEPFTQEEHGYARGYEGTGLGITLAKKYCDMNGIVITIESKKGEGTKFTLVFTRTK